jgi:hypothetical protein
MNCEERSLEAARRSIGDRLSRQLWSLQSGSLCEEARRRTGLRDFGDPPIEPALSILVNSLEIEADLHPLGRFLMRAHLRELLETRLRLAQVWGARSQALEGYGHANLFLEEQWQLMGALEALNGMLLFGLTTAFLFAMIQKVWPLGSRGRHR